jgi:hypothetical protein
MDVSGLHFPNAHIEAVLENLAYGLVKVTHTLIVNLVRPFMIGCPDRCSSRYAIFSFIEVMTP